MIEIWGQDPKGGRHIALLPGAFPRVAAPVLCQTEYSLFAGSSQVAGRRSKNSKAKSQQQTNSDSTVGRRQQPRGQRVTIAAHSSRNKIITRVEARDRRSKSLA